MNRDYLAGSRRRYESLEIGHRRVPGGMTALFLDAVLRQPFLEHVVGALFPVDPDLTSIEKMWSKMKEGLRSAKTRTAETLETAIARALESITPADAAHWFASCGYTIN